MKKIEKFAFTFMLILLVLQFAYSCITPNIKNEYGVPCVGGVVPINGSKYPIEQKLIIYNFTVKNINTDEGMDVTLTPASSLFNYAYQGSAYVGPLSSAILGVPVYVDGRFKSGELIISGQCDGGMPIGGDLRVYVSIYGRGNSDPETCLNTEHSCGIFPDCQDLTELSGCEDGYNKVYSCVGNMPKLTSYCTGHCCEEFKGPTAYCGNVDGVTTCLGPEDYCVDECDFQGTQCIGDSVYECIPGEDTCLDLVEVEICQNLCHEGECTYDSDFIGKIAYVCRTDDCDDGIEQDLTFWLQSTGWFVRGKSSDSWTNSELNKFDMILCSDQTVACKQSSGLIHYKHTEQRMPFIEVSDYRYANQAFKFDYLSNYNGFLVTTDEVENEDDIITEVFDSPMQVFSQPGKITGISDSNFEPIVENVANIIISSRSKSTIFKVSEGTFNGRYSYVGLFYRLTPQDLTQDGFHLFNRTLIWTAYGDEALSDPNRNDPPVAISSITPYPMGYEQQVIQFDGSQSYDPEGLSLTYYWDFGDDTNSGWITQSTTTHVYQTQGDYQITLTVNDGELDSEPDAKTLTILPIIKNKVAFVCSSDACDKNSEINLMDWFTSKGFYVEGKSQYSWENNDLMNYDFMVCTDSGKGCSVKSWSAVYDRHVNQRMGFLEVPDYERLRAANSFKYVSWWVGFKSDGNNVKQVTEDIITSVFPQEIQVLNSQEWMGNLMTTRIKPFAKNLLNIPDKDSSVSFKVEPGEESAGGRYAYVGWLYKSDPSSMTQDGNSLLLRTARWVQCGDPEGCS